MLTAQEIRKARILANQCGFNQEEVKNYFIPVDRIMKNVYSENVQLKETIPAA